MRNIAIIGAGQLGSRHLQALALYNGELNIYIIDPKNASLEISKKRYEQVDNYQNKNIYFGNHISILPKKLDFAIIATTSAQRLEILKQLLKHSKVDYLLMEKFLFPKVNEYEQALKLISDNKVKAYVNCARRAWPIYQEIRNAVSGDLNINVTVSGSNWNMASNSIHFFDLYFYLSGDKKMKISTKALDPELISNKRDGYIEVTGALNGISSNGEIQLNSNNLESAPVEILIESDKHKYIILEEKEVVRIYEDDKNYVREEKIKALKQSELTHNIFQQLIETDTCDLVPFEESTTHHLLLLNAFNEFLGDREGMIT